MLYVKGKFVKKVGPFSQTIKFEGTTGDNTAEYIECIEGNHWVIQEYRFEEADIESVIKINTRAKTLNLAKLKGDAIKDKYKVEKIDGVEIHLKRSIIAIEKAKDILADELAKAARYKRVVSREELLENCDAEIRFYKSLLKIEARKKNTREMDKVVERAIYRIAGMVQQAKTAPTYNQLIKNMLKAK